MFDSKLTDLLCQASRRQLLKENSFLLQLVAAKLQAQNKSKENESENKNIE